jgi:hypothetical protein
MVKQLQEGRLVGQTGPGCSRRPLLRQGWEISLEGILACQRKEAELLCFAFRERVVKGASVLQTAKS